jgi:hypothetical protein
MEEQMGLDMKTRKKICRRICKRYQQSSKKDKAKILEEYGPLLGHNRDYLAHLLTNWGKTRFALSGDKSIKLVAKPPRKGRLKAPGSIITGRPEKYHKAFVEVLSNLWEFFDYHCGKLLAPILRGMITFLVPEFGFSEEIRSLLLSVSPATIDRKLRKGKVRFHRKGINTTKPGSLLKSQIPIRVCFDWNEKSPGFFEADMVSHCGANAKGQFCQTLTLTDVGSGWT